MLVIKSYEWLKQICAVLMSPNDHIMPLLGLCTWTLQNMLQFLLYILNFIQ